MREKFKLCLLLILLSLLWSCNNDYASEFVQTECHNNLTVEQAKNYYDKYHSMFDTRIGIDKRLPFVIGNAEWLWNEAKVSMFDNRAAVDIPIEGGYKYKVYRLQTSGEYKSVNTFSKVVAIKSSATENISFYIRVSIPDVDDDIAHTSLNFEDRKNYSGLEYYITLDGCPVGIAKYKKGELIDGVFLYDKNIEKDRKFCIFANIFKDLCIARYNGVTRNDPEMEYGAPGEIFYDQFGTMYVYVDLDNDGKSDAVTGIFPEDVECSYNMGGGTNGGGSTGNSGSSGSGIGSGFGSGFGGLGGSGDGGSDSSGGDGSDGDSSGSGLDDENNPIFGYFHDDWRFPTFTPRRDIANCKSDPLLIMSNGICPTPMAGSEGGRFGNARGRQHNGLDLNADVGTSVFAMFSGVVIYAVGKYDGDIPFKDYSKHYTDPSCNLSAGNKIAIKSVLADGRTIYVKYFHLDTVYVLPGQHVIPGEVVGTTGQTGSASSENSGGPHLHLEVRLGSLNGMPLNPEDFLYTTF